MTKTKRLLTLTLMGLLGLTGAASAGGKLPLAAEQSPPKYLDEPELVLYLIGRGSDGYVFRFNTYVYGVTSPSDAIRVEWLSGSKVAASQRCNLQVNGDQARVECDLEKPIKVTGDVTARIVYIDDQTEKEYLLRDLQVKVAKMPWMNDMGYQLLLDDNLGTAWAYHQMTGDQYKRGDHELKFFFWTSSILAFQTAQLRCSVNGQKIPDFEAASQSSYDIEGLYHVKGEERRYHWQPVVMTPRLLKWGKEADIKKHFGYSDDDWKRGGDRALGNLPGDWDCVLRADGKQIRRFMFKVDADGKLVRSAAESAPGFPKTLPSVVWVDMRLPEKNEWDTRVNPAAIKRSMQYGLPWPKHEIFDRLRKEVPPQSGFADPK
jgi:hypothetical protein